MEQPCRKSPRLTGYDYSAPGVYFVTICTKNKQCILSKIVGGDVLIAPQVELTACGRILDEQLQRMNELYDHITVEQYVIMPNHIHLLLRVEESGPTGTSAPTKSRPHQAVADFVSTCKRFCTRRYGHPLFQRSYHDHIIRGDADYEKIARYIAENPARWQEDCFYKP